MLLAATGCALFDSDDDSEGAGGASEGPERTAKGLAAALTSGELAGVDFAGKAKPARERWKAITASMEEVPRKVELAGVTGGDNGRAKAKLDWSWDLGTTSWSYQTTAVLTNGPDWRVKFSPTLIEPSLRAREVLEVSRTQAQRADILGAGGAALVTDRPVMRVGVDKTKVGSAKQDRAARRLAKLLEIDVGSYVEQVRAAGDQAFVEALTLRLEQAQPLSDQYAAIPGVLAVADRIPLAPTREFARPILGTVGPVTAELVEKSKGKYQPGDQVGLSGLQQRFDGSLAGNPRLVVEASHPSRDKPRSLFRSPARGGAPLRTTLDLELQRAAEDVLADVGPASALVAIRPSNGNVLAAASGPGSDGYSTATIGRYAPGSTFKIVTSLALLRSGLTPDSTVFCTETTTVDGKAFENYDDYPSSALGEIALRDAFAHSCNVAFIRAGQRVEQKALTEAAAALGLGVDQDLGFPAYFGSVPTKATGTEHAASTIGQGELLASPLAMAAVAASVAEGRTVVPRLLPKHEADTTAPTEPLTGDEAATLRSMMRSVVTDGSGSFLGDVPGKPVRAKTGTAEFGTSDPPATHAWMVATHGDLAVAAFVEVGDSGSRTAGPLLEESLRAAS